MKRDGDGRHATRLRRLERLGPWICLLALHVGVASAAYIVTSQTAVPLSASITALLRDPLVQLLITASLYPGAHQRWEEQRHLPIAVRALYTIFDGMTALTWR